MKLIKFVPQLSLGFLFLFLVFVSCSKDTAQTTTPVPTYPIQGLWVGTYTVDGQPGLSQYYSFIIKTDGTMLADAKSISPVQQHISVGNWSLADTVLTCNYTNIYGISFNIGIVQTSTAKWDKTGKLTGTWRNVGVTGSGTFTMNRVN
jgi:hypothetical protein